MLRGDSYLQEKTKQSYNQGHDTLFLLFIMVDVDDDLSSSIIYLDIVNFWNS